MSYPEANMAPQQGNLPPPPGIDTEGGQGRPESNFKGVSEVNKQFPMNKGVLVLIFRAVALLFSFLAFMIMVTLPFTYYSALSYVVAISIFAIVYTAVLVGLKGHEVLTGQEVIKTEVFVWIEFVGDQVMALLLLSAASAGAGLGLSGQWAASVGMCFLAFFALEPAALISGYNFALHFSKCPSMGIHAC